MKSTKSLLGLGVLLVALGLAGTGLSAREAEEPLPLLIVAKVKVKSEHSDAFIKAASLCVEETRKEPGCISYSFYQDPNERGTFLYFEEWKDQAAIEAHFQAPHMAKFFGTVQSYLSEPPQVVRYELAGRKKL